MGKLERSREKFIVLDQLLINDGVLVILSDVEFWYKNWEELDRWLAFYNLEPRAGMTLTLPTEMLTLFSLRWS